MRLRIKSMIWNIKKQKTTTTTTTKNPRQSEQEEKRIQKNEECVCSPHDNFRCSNIRMIRVPEGEEKEQEIGNLFLKNNERKLR